MFYQSTADRFIWITASMQFIHATQAIITFLCIIVHWWLFNSFAQHKQQLQVNSCLTPLCCYHHLPYHRSCWLRTYPDHHHHRDHFFPRNFPSDWSLVFKDAIDSIVFSFASERAFGQHPPDQLDQWTDSKMVNPVGVTVLLVSLFSCCDNVFGWGNN